VLDKSLDERGRRVFTHVDVRQLHDAESVQGRGQVWNFNGDTFDTMTKASNRNSVGNHQPRGAAQSGGRGLEKTTTARIDMIPTGSG
jgi:hypothetical protein